MDFLDGIAAGAANWLFAWTLAGEMMLLLIGASIGVMMLHGMARWCRRDVW